MSYQDPYGNPIRRKTDEYGNPVHQGGATGGGYGTTNPYGGGDQYQPHRQQEQGHGVSGMLHRSGSSSSSEDDGKGGRRKKGLKEKIKEKLPGQGNRDQQTQSSATTTPGSGGYVDSSGQYHEKKGVMEKIKEKLPGGHH